MDYQYAFRQAHQDRLEDAGVVQYRPADGFRVLRHARRRQYVSPAPRLRSVFVALVSVFAK
jgi:hypothetical protein